MKSLYLVVIFFASTVLADAAGVKGTVTSTKGCSSPVMVWLSLDKEAYKERLLLMHTEVPVGGSFQFYLKPGDYQLRASDEKGCEFLQKIKVSTKVSTVKVQMEKK